MKKCSICSAVLVVTLLMLVGATSGLAAPHGDLLSSDRGGKAVSQPGCAAIESYGGVGDGTTFNDVPLADAVAASVSARPGFPCVKFDVGVYRFKRTFQYTIAYTGSLIFVGEGSLATRLQWVAGQNGIILRQSPESRFNPNTLSTFHLRHLTLATEGIDVNAYGLSLYGVGQYGTYPVSDLTDFSLEGSDGHGGVDYWGVGIFLFGWSEINITGGHILNGAAKQPGTIGVVIDGSASQETSIVNIESLLIGFYDIGIKYANNTQGITINQSNILGCTYGVYVPPGQAGILGQLTYTSNQSNCSGAQLRLDTELDPVQISNNLFESASGVGNAGIYLGASKHAILTGNVFLGQGGTGLYARNSAPGAAQIVADNIFSGFATAIDLDDSSTGWTIHDNRLGGGTCARCTVNGNFEHDDH